jgi:hypothetical protein
MKSIKQSRPLKNHEEDSNKLTGKEKDELENCLKECMEIVGLYIIAISKIQDQVKLFVSF